MLATSKPIVVVLLHGRPNSIPYIAANVPAILDGWYLGQEGATALADVLFGDYRPTGKLPFSWPKSMAQVPLSAIASKGSPLFPLGFGLSY